MKLKTLIKLFLIIILAFLLKKENDYFYFGKTINSVFPCNQSVGDSFPCYGSWDMGLLVLGFLFCVLLLISAIADL
ncbi:hypothetical protein M0Q03_01775, partial [bacterium]|nr:hypothetical protein [bacterium]